MTKIDAKLFTAINKYASSKGELRYYLNGVCLDISEDSAFMVATDGWKLLVAPFENTDIPNGRYIIPRKLIENIKVFKKNDTSKIEVSIVNDTVSLGFHGSIFVGNLIDGTFPDWRRVIPQEQSGEPARFNGSHLKDLEDAAKAVNAVKPLVGFNGWNPCWVSFPGSKLFGVIMPSIKSKSPDPTLPNFLKIT